MKVHYGIGAFCLVMLALVVGATFNAQATAVQIATSVELFDRAKDSQPFAIAMIYNSKNKNEKLKRLKDKFVELSKGEIFDKIGFAFIEADVSQEDLKVLVARYELNDLQEPAFILFKNKHIVKDDGMVAVEYGYLAPNEIFAFIDDYFGDDIDLIVEKIIKSMHESEPQGDEEDQIPQGDEDDQDDEDDSDESVEPKVISKTRVVTRYRPSSSVTLGLGIGSDCYYDFPYFYCGGYNPYYYPYYYGYPGSFWGWPWGGHRRFRDRGYYRHGGAYRYGGSRVSHHGSGFVRSGGRHVNAVGRGGRSISSGRSISAVGHGGGRSISGVSRGGMGGGRSMGGRGGMGGGGRGGGGRGGGRGR